jgi:hypothetical protein
MITVCEIGAFRKASLHAELTRIDKLEGGAHQSINGIQQNWISVMEYMLVMPASKPIGSVLVCFRHYPSFSMFNV